jgi:hypothetical protein
MKPLAPLAGSPPASSAALAQQVAWLMKLGPEIVRNSRVDAMTIAQSYKITNLPTTPVRSLNVATATTAQIAALLGQFIQDLRATGANIGT